MLQRISYLMHGSPVLRGDGFRTLRCSALDRSFSFQRTCPLFYIGSSQVLTMMGTLFSWLVRVFHLTRARITPD